MSWDKLKSLTPFVQAVALQKATEAPFSGRFLQVVLPYGIPNNNSAHIVAGLVLTIE